ncbi:MAG: hypothetical protein KGL51_10585 [Betaproteobacteria bacterium]|nr:hypothetical protein [Betaproteobacteria bacterium]
MKIRWVLLFKIFAISCFITQFDGCFVMTSSTPHQAFIGNYGWYVGKDISWIEDNFNPKLGFRPFSRRILPNGDVEIEIDNALAHRNCKIFYIYNTQTKLIVSWRYEGADDQCAINPYT